MNIEYDSFDNLSPDIFINAVEDALGKHMSGMASPLNSYINRVYELQAMDGTRYVAKFYRPGRWTKKALQDEHDFVLGCKVAEIPVIDPLILKNGTTLGDVEGGCFAVFPKKLGRGFELNDDDDWRRIGGVLGRLHNVGAKEIASERIKHHPEYSTKEEIDYLLNGGFIPRKFYSEFNGLCDDIFKTINFIFDDVEYIRTHGDCHCGNILHRPGEGIMLIDFDDMMMAPPVQDLWLILPDHAYNSKRELNAMIDGYEQFREFDYFSIKLIEPLRIMRMLYFLSWLAKQSKDHKFLYNFPHWGTDSYWRQEINDLSKQLLTIKMHLK
jgi:Ser/Thr protein kinase RdoA (MazF antagonist)